MQSSYDAQLLHLVALLDDPDPFVQAHIFKRLQEGGVLWCQALQQLAQEADDASHREALLQAVHKLESTRYLTQLEQWIADPKDNLLMGLYLVQCSVSPTTSYAQLESQLMDGVNEVCTELRDDQTMMEQVQLFNHLFYRRMGYKPSDPFIQDEAFALMDKLFESRKGNPITLGLIYVMMAYYAGVPIRTVVFKGGFLPTVVDKDGTSVFYVNIFKNGSLFAAAQLDQFIKDSGLPIPADSFREATPVDLAQIFAESLYFLYSTKENKEKEARMEDVMRRFGSSMNLIMEEDEDE